LRTWVEDLDALIEVAKKNQHGEVAPVAETPFSR